MIGGGLMGATHGHITGQLSESNVDIELATQALQLLGLSPKDAMTAINDSTGSSASSAEFRK